MFFWGGKPLLSFEYLIIIWSSFDHFMIFPVARSRSNVEAMSIVLPLRPGPSYRDNFSCFVNLQCLTRLAQVNSGGAYWKSIPVQDGIRDPAVRRSGDVSSCRSSPWRFEGLEGLDTPWPTWLYSMTVWILSRSKSPWHLAFAKIPMWRSDGSICCDMLIDMLIDISCQFCCHRSRYL